MEAHPIRSKAAKDALRRIRKVVEDCPEVVEAVDNFGHLTLRVRNKPFVFLTDSENGPSVSVKTDLDTQALLIARGHYDRTPYIGQHGWISTSGFPPIWDECEELVRESYLRVAPRSLTRSLRAE